MKGYAFIYRLGLRLVLAAWYYYEKIIRTGAFSRKAMISVRTPYRPCGKRAKDLLYHFHVKQFHESSCSVASVACMINALLALEGKPPENALTQQDLLDQVNAEQWKERMSEGGYHGKRGLPLEVLGNVIKASLLAYGISGASVDVVKAVPENPPAFRKKLQKRLERFEEKSDCFIIAHFDQGSFIPEYHIPHISPVGGYNIQTREVTLLDVDPDQADPYRVSFEIFCRGLEFNYHHLFRPFGYFCGGYIFIEHKNPM